MDIRRKITVLRALADDPRTPEAERRAAAAAVAAWEARLAEDQPAPPAPTPAEARSRALPPGPIDQVVLVLDRDTRTKGHVLSVVEVTARGEKHVLGRWSITMRIEWAEDAGEYLGFFGEGGRAAAAGERVAAMKIDVPESSVLRRLFDASQVMSLFVETGEQGVVYFGRAFIDSYEDRGWNDSRVSIVTLDEATQVGDLAPERPALPGARRVLAENGSRPKLTPPRLAPMREPGEDDDE
jgi:hypothetical protein